MTVRTRFAPSPTGHLHIGGLRTALYSYAFAKSLGGEFLLRIEDTDRARLVPGATEKIIEKLKLFGLNWDEGPYLQSERVKTGIYQEQAEKLLTNNHAYYCFCPPQTQEEIKTAHRQKKIELRDPCRELPLEEGRAKIAAGKEPAIRLRIPGGEKVSYHDFVLKKEVTWETDHIDEVMLLKSDGFPTYHLGVVVDDALMGVTHVIRGRDWLPSTPVHLLLFQYFGFPLPQIGHLTDILDPQGGKLSKRKGSVSVEEFLAEGYLSEAILNFIMLLGWAPKDNRELFTLEEFVANFQKGELQTANPIFNRAKLDWFNGYYLRRKTDTELVELLRPYVGTKANSLTLAKVVPLVKERITKLSEFASLAGFFFTPPKIDRSLFRDLDYPVHLKGAREYLLALPDWTNESIQTALTVLISQNNWKTGDFYMSLRIALTGSRFTPPITESAEILGKAEVLARLKVLL